MPKSSTGIEVIGDSEEEQPQSPKKNGVEDADDKNKGKSDDASMPEDEEGDEEEYEIEAILEAKHGAFPGNLMGYFVKWKGYGDEHNSWVTQEDAENAQLLISEFWRKQGKDNKGKPKSSKARARKSETRDDTSNASVGNKRRKSSTTRRKSKSSQPDGDDNAEEDEEEDMPKAKKARKVSRVRTSEDRMDLDGEDDADSQYRPMQRYKEKKSWENLVQRVDTIEKVEGNLKVFFTLNNGDKVVESSQECARHFPQKLIQFYESNLRWRESES